jgi:DNA helicase-2/ATP-dependent DNA helicase PcrA
MIDEFQDIDPLQYRLMEVLCGYHHNLFIVGDPDQTIYTWRGANVTSLCSTVRTL